MSEMIENKKPHYKNVREGVKEFQEAQYTCECGCTNNFPYRTDSGMFGWRCSIYCGKCGKTAMYFHFSNH